MPPCFFAALNLLRGIMSRDTTKERQSDAHNVIVMGSHTTGMSVKPFLAN